MVRRMKPHHLLCSSPGFCNTTLPGAFVSAAPADQAPGRFTIREHHRLLEMCKSARGNVRDPKESEGRPLLFQHLSAWYPPCLLGRVFPKVRLSQFFANT